MGAGVTSGVDCVLHMRLAETNFGAKKEYLVYFKDYLKALKEKLERQEREGLGKSAQDPETPLRNFERIQGSAILYRRVRQPRRHDPLLDYQDIDGEERPVVFFPKYGI